ncbi:MAG: hypothetical protein H7Y06_08820 [Opitutaceae bacterium]|nr:hypothetical protein [Opitutaceae bacterium]
MSWFGHFRNESRLARCISDIRRESTAGTLRRQRVKPVYNWLRRCIYPEMKRCGQWLFVLWIATALLYPQAASAISWADGKTTQLGQSQVQSLPLLADFTFKKTVKTEADYRETPDNTEHIRSESAPHVSAPTCVTPRPQTVTPVQTFIETVREKLPFVCGPPVQN